MVAVVMTEGRDIDLEQVTHNVMPPGLHLDYDLDFQSRRVGNIRQLQRPEIPGKPISFNVDEGLWGHDRAPPKPGAPSPSRDGGMVFKM